jgi:hypothetical protein
MPNCRQRCCIARTEQGGRQKGGGRRFCSDHRRRRQRNEVSVSGFGKFKVKATPAREGRNPSTGETIEIKGTKKLTFGPAKAVKNRPNG